MHKDLFGQRVGERLRAARRYNNLSQEELGKLIGTSKQQIFKYEKAMDTPSLSRLVQLAETLNMPPEFFIGRYVVSTNITDIENNDIQNTLLHAYETLNRHNQILLLSIAQALVECSGRVNGPKKTARSAGALAGEIQGLAIKI